MPSAVKQPQTLYDKVFEDHIVEEKEDGTILLYIGMLPQVPCTIYILTNA
jgi:homoaconitase/3-isopropylmalate dehydratase large subunit